LVYTIYSGDNVREKLEIIAENLHLKGTSKYIALGVFCLVMIFFVSKLSQIKPVNKPIKNDVVFTLNGDKVVTLFEYDTFNDLGVIAKDENGNDISSKVVIVGSVNTNIPGIYDILYKININGQIKELERTYVVLANEGAYIELVGGSVINLVRGSEYVEPGFTAVDSILGDVTDSVVVTNNVNTDIVGTYLITYSFVGSNEELQSVTRTVNVNDILPSDLDFSLIGDKTIEMLSGCEYVEPGYKAIDSFYGDISDKVIVSGSVNTNKSGTYTLKYVVTNDSGIQKVLYRTIKVFDKTDGVLTFTLNGSSSITIVEGNNYVEQGCKAIDSIDGDISKKVSINGKVYTNIPGVYTLTYKITNTSGISKTLTRRVVVVAKNVGQITLTLNGSDSYSIAFGSKFVEPGYKAIDSIDGDITNKVVITGSVNTNVAGTYSIVYKVTNSTGVTKSVTRKVVVTRDLNLMLINATKGYTNNSVMIEYVVEGDNFNKVVLPDGSSKSLKGGTYYVTQNGSYVFKAYSNTGKYVERTINVSNIDRDKPIGSCIASIINGNTYVDTNISDNGSGIKGFKYIVDSYTSNIITNTYYSMKGSASYVSVVAYDNLNNSSTIGCRIVNGDSSGSTVISGSTVTAKVSYGKIRNYWLYKPDDYDIDKKAFIIFLHGGGELGYDITEFKNVAFYKYVNNGQKYNAVILMPQLTEGKWTEGSNLSNLKKLIDEIADTYNVDKSRISITGNSLGGIATYAMIEKYPDYFSAAAPIAGRWSYSSASMLAKTPIWAFHGSEDKSVSYTVDYNLINKVREVGGDARLTTFEGWAHSGVTEKTFTETDVISWLINTRKS